MATVTGNTATQDTKLFGVPLYLNQSTSKMRHWCRALARVRTNISDAKLLFVGDSTTAGVGGTPGNASNGGGIYSTPYQVAAILNKGVVSAARGLGVPPAPGNQDSRWTRPASWSSSGTYGWGKNACYGWLAAGSPDSIVYTDTVLADRYDVYYLTASGLGSFIATATGGTGVTQATAGSNGIGRVTISAGSAATTNAVTITPSNNGTVYVIGIEPWYSIANQIRVGNAGVGGATAADWASSSTSGRGGTDAIIAYAPDLTVISLGLNDATNSTDPSTFTSYMQTIITAARISGDVILYSTLPPTSAASAARQTYVPQYNAAISALGEPYIDLITRFGSGDSQSALGMMSDSVHPTALGYADIAQALSRVLANI